MIVNKDVLEDMLDISKDVFAQTYEIESVYLVDNYWTGDPDTTDSPRWSHSNADDYIKRNTGPPHVITHGDLGVEVL